MDNSDGCGPSLGTDQTVGHVVSLHLLKAEALESLPDTVADDRTVSAHRGSGAEVWLDEIVGGGRRWPGSGPPRDIVAAEEIGSYFQRRPVRVATGP